MNTGASHWSFLKETFSNLHRPSDVVLDAGCGKGSLLNSLDCESVLVGVDIKRVNIQHAHKTRRSSETLFVVGDIKHLPFQPGIFNLVVCQDVLEHVEDGEATIRELHGSLRKRGTLLLSTSNVWNPCFILDMVVPDRISDAIIRRLSRSQHYGRTRHVSPGGLSSMLSRHGFRSDLIMFDLPLVRSWMYRVVWRFFSTLTNLKTLQRFKEIIVVITQKRGGD